MRAHHLLLALSLAGCGGTPSPAAAPEAVVADTASAEIPRITPASRRNIPSVMRTAYPVLLRDAGVGGSANARFVVLADGTVDRESIVITRSDSSDWLATAVVLVLTRLRFVPARVNGAPVPAPLRAALSFSPGTVAGTIHFYGPAAGSAPR
jgi:outer membrane biosynthesis protein TonB